MKKKAAYEELENRILLLEKTEIEQNEKGRQYRAVCESIFDWTYSFNIGQNGENNQGWVDVGFQRTTGYPPEQGITPEELYKIIHIDDLEIVKSRMEKLVIDGGSQTNEYRIKDYSGKSIWIRDFAKAKKGGPNKKIYNRIYGAVQVITKQHQTEERFKKNQERFELAVQTTKDGLYDWDLIKKEIYYSPGWKRMLGYKKSELPNVFSVWEDLLSPGDVKRLRKMQQELIDLKRNRFELVFRMKHKDGHWIDVLSRAGISFDDKGRAIRIVGTHIDISELKLLRREVFDKEETLRIALDAVKAGTWTWDIISGDVIWDDQMQKNFGIEPGTFEGTFEAWKKCVHPDDLQAAEQATLDALKHNKEYSYEYRVRNPSGGWKVINARAITLKNDSGKPIRMSGFATDVTKLKTDKQQTENTTSQLKERTKELNCLYAISKLAENESLTIDSLMQSVADLMIPSFQYPKITCAVATINNTAYQTKFFKDTKWKISAPIRIDSKKVGLLIVYYTDKKPNLDEGPFLKEERYLIDSVCNLLGKILESKKHAQNIKEIEDRYQILTNHIADGVVVIQDDQYKFINKSFAEMLEYSSKYLLNKKFSQFILPQFSSLYKESIILDSEEGNIQAKIEYQLLSKSGNKIWVEEKRNKISWNNAPAMLCIMRDINQGKQREISSKNETRELREENIRLRSSLKERFRFQNIIGQSEPMQRVYDLILSAANSDANVSIYGESGTGKELVANAIHDLSERKEKIFVPVNCGAVPESLLESEFFGYKKGAFTGAAIDKHGYLNLADGGTLFLDEIGELQLNMQAKLLRAIDGGGYHPIGSNKKLHTDFRIVTATNKDLKNEVIKGNMREDFYYRIHVIPVTIPPLRERKDDIPFLVEHFSKMYSGESAYTKIPEKFLEKIFSYDWPGNVRELQNTLLRFFSTGQFELLDRIYGMSGNEGTDHFTAGAAPLGGSLHQKIEDYERNLILNTLKENNWHRNKTSEKLGVTRNTLFRKINKYGLTSIQT